MYRPGLPKGEQGLPKSKQVLSNKTVSLEFRLQAIGILLRGPIPKLNASICTDRAFSRKNEAFSQPSECYLTGL